MGDAGRIKDIYIYLLITSSLPLLLEVRKKKKKKNDWEFRVVTSQEKLTVLVTYFG